MNHGWSKKSWSISDSMKWFFLPHENHLTHYDVFLGSNNDLNCLMWALARRQQLPLLTANNLQHGEGRQRLDLGLQSQSGPFHFPVWFQRLFLRGFDKFTKTNTVGAFQPSISDVFPAWEADREAWGKTNDRTTETFQICRPFNVGVKAD